MVYPVLDYESLKARCRADIEKFKEDTKKELNLNNTTKNRKSTEIDALQNDTYALLTSDILQLPSAVDTIKKRINALIPVNNKDMRYVEYIKENIADNIKYQLWMERTYLFYQILIYATATFINEELYNTTYRKGTIRADEEPYTFREDIRAELTNFKLGIFGSMTPTSDIDVGIQYSGISPTYQPGLAYVVSRIENLFYILTGQSSLAYDIEFYADMMTIPNPLNRNQDIFYLDATNFTVGNFKKMLPCAYASIIRNVALASNPPTLPEPFTLNTIFSNETFKPYLGNDFKASINASVSFNDENLFNDAKQHVILFLRMDEDAQRYTYYAKVAEAETAKQTLIHSSPLKGQLYADAICDVMVKIGEALTYRMESYTCAPTVIHVVRILQANKNSLNKYSTSTPLELCPIGSTSTQLEPYCAIGYYGFLLSALEQVGYMYRFYLTYCPDGSHPDDAKCKSKITKYKKRYDNALELLKKQPIKHNQEGGRRHRKHRNRTKKRRHLKKKRTLRRRVV
jgi:hypothetical protein